MKLCWNDQYGPIPVNAEYKAWSVIHVPSREDISWRKIFYVDDDAGELWEFLVDENGLPRTDDHHNLLVEKHLLGPGKLRLVKRNG